MTHPASSIRVAVDITNPGQFFACCGLLELAHRLWPGAEAWFEEPPHYFSLAGAGVDAGTEKLLRPLRECVWSGLTEQERQQQADLDARSRAFKKQGQQLAQAEDERRKRLGEQARSGVLRLGTPFDLVLDWWQNGTAPKTWAGRQEIHKIARAAQDTLAAVADATRLLDYYCVLRTPREYCMTRSDHNKAVEPFYFDARRFAGALDTGWSLDVQDAEASARTPAVELLCLIGLQRFRPSTTSDERWTYRTWSHPLAVAASAAVVGGAMPFPGCRTYRFSMRYRDDQRRYKAFGVATVKESQE